VALTKLIRGSTEATRHSDMARTALELGLRAGGNWFHDAHQDDRALTPITRDFLSPQLMFQGA
jgi:hypothetical protein